MFLPFEDNATAVRLTMGGKDIEITLEDITVSQPYRYRDYLVSRLLGKPIFLELVGQNKAYLYIPAVKGDWTMKYATRLTQANLDLVKLGIAVPTDTLENRYAHFYRGALARAQVDHLGVWADR